MAYYHHPPKWDRVCRRDSSLGIIQNKVDISLRSLIVDEKNRFVGLEMDAMISMNHKDKTHSITADKVKIACVKESAKGFDVEFYFIHPCHS